MLIIFIAERMITDERNYLKGRPNCARSTSRWGKQLSGALSYLGANYRMKHLEIFADM